MKNHIFIRGRASPQGRKNYFFYVFLLFFMIFINLSLKNDKIMKTHKSRIRLWDPDKTVELVERCNSHQESNS